MRTTLDGCSAAALVIALTAGVQAWFGLKGLQGGGATVSTVFAFCVWLSLSACVCACLIDSEREQRYSECMSKCEQLFVSQRALSLNFSWFVHMFVHVCV